MQLKFLNRKNLIPLLVVLAILLLYALHFRIDLTSDKRYSISPQTKQLLRQLDDEVSVRVFLTGDLNPGFTQLKKATAEMLDEMQAYSDADMHIVFENPSEAASNDERNANYARLSAAGLKPTAVYERDKEGKAIQKIVFPWMVLQYKGRSVNVALLKNVHRRSGEENLNISIENLEFEITDGIRRLINTNVSRIAFLEGHGELNEAQTWDISKSLSRYFQIDRGVISDDAAVLSPYRLVVIAKPRKAFTEPEKFILDQYIMNGGKVIWLVDGVQMAEENLSKTGLTPAMGLDVNLNDMFFNYGVRINPVILEDVQCQTVPVNIAPKGEEPQFEPAPLLYAPLLLASDQHPISKNISEVRAEITSSIDVVGDLPQQKATLLLATSGSSHVIPTPVNVDLSEVHKPDDKTYFNTGYVPVAVLMEGKFRSNFENRMLPQVANLPRFTTSSVPTSQLFIADGDVIKNETSGVASDSTTLELGLDRYSGVVYGNRDFLTNAVLYMTDEVGWMQLKSKTLRLRLLNKDIAQNNGALLAVLNIAVPLLLLLMAAWMYHLMRRRKYVK